MCGYAVADSRVFLDDVWTSLNCAWVPGLPRVTLAAALKFTQLRAAATLGFTLPNTLITNNPDDFLQSRRAQGSQLISKLPGPSLFFQPGPGVNRYTQPLIRIEGLTQLPISAAIADLLLDYGSLSVTVVPSLKPVVGVGSPAHLLSGSS